MKKHALEALRPQLPPTSSSSRNISPTTIVTRIKCNTHLFALSSEMTEGNQECQRSPLGLTFQDTIFQYSYKLLRALSPEYLLIFFLKCIYPGKSPDLWCSDLLESAVDNQIFTMSLQTKLSTRFLPSPPQAKGNYSTPSRHLLFS